MINEVVSTAWQAGASWAKKRRRNRHGAVVMLNRDVTAQAELAVTDGASDVPVLGLPGVGGADIALKIIAHTYLGGDMVNVGKKH